jgi:polyisoprenyl-phosphate glycosyltransferase
VILSPPDSHVKTVDLTVHAIIPVFNEAGTIRNVLSVLRQVEYLDEIIVVNDGSTDGSGLAIEAEADIDERIRMLAHPVNLGKGQSILSASRSSPADLLLLLDADLHGLEPDHVRELVEPVVEGNADMTIGQFKHGYWRTDISHWFTPWLSGQRCLRTELLESISPRAAAGYGIETALTAAAKQDGWRCLRVPMIGVWHRPSEQRRGLLNGFVMRSKMYAQIGRAWFLSYGAQKNGSGPALR